MSLITLEDINTWLLKYAYSYQVLTLDCSTAGDFGTHIVRIDSGWKTIVLRIPLNIKMYSEYELDVNQGDPSIIRADSRINRVYVLLNQSNTTPLCFNRLPYWMPKDNPNVLSLQGDLNHKLYLTINNSSQVTSINWEDVKRDQQGSYITYNALYENTGLYVTPSEDDVEVYPCNLQVIPSAPHITVEKSLYRGNSNNLSDLFSLPSEDIEYTVYYQGKKLTDELFIPRDYEDDTIRLRVVTKSYEPYIGMDVFIDVPVGTKLLTTLEDLNNYDYGCINLLENITGEINNDIIIVKQDNTSGLSHCNLTINGNVEFRDLQYIEQTLIINNSNLKITDADINSKYHTGFEWVNNGTLTLDNVTIHTPSGFILNNNVLQLYNSIIIDDLDSDKNLPIIHSATSTYDIQNNEFNLFGNKAGYNICLIRCDEVDVDSIILNNNINYSCLYNVEYTVNGSGVAYCQIDNDTITFNNLEVTE